MMELDDGYGGGDGQNEDQVLQTSEKKKEKNKVVSRQRYI